jgi:hypothetical protein
MWEKKVLLLQQKFITKEILMEKLSFDAPIFTLIMEN